ncbi:uncharacterized protein RHIMIDRAFT_198193, partial [Rhizopus microsporus ATCC 52813]
PAQDSDLNPIENVWSELARYLRKQKANITNTESSKKAIFMVGKLCHLSWRRS